MEQRAKELAARAKISEEVAEKAVEVSMDLLKKRLPDPLFEPIEKALSGDLDLGDLAKGLGSLLGG